MDKRAILGFTILLVCYDSFASNAEEAFDVRHHLSTVTRYHVGKEMTKNLLASSNIPDQCSPIHLNLVARHGTRDPTKKKMKDMEALSIQLKSLIKNAKERGSSLENLPSWIQNWSSPWKGKSKGGYLVPQGEDELYHLGIRIKGRFPELFNDSYHPDLYQIRASQVPRASASAVAFSMGMFSGQKEGRHRAFSVITESRENDIMLRFHDYCPNYREITKSQESVVQKIKQPVLDEISLSLVRRYELNFTSKDISSLWFLCEQEASLSNIVDQACGLFTNDEFEKLEREESMEVPPKPPQKRIWRDSQVAPFGGNNALVLHHCPSKNESKYFVQVLHNEQPMSMAGCGNSNFCPFEVFKEKIAGPHLKHKYKNICNGKLEQMDNESYTSKLLQMLKLVFLGKDRNA